MRYLFFSETLFAGENSDDVGNFLICVLLLVSALIRSMDFSFDKAFEKIRYKVKAVTKRSSMHGNI